MVEQSITLNVNQFNFDYLYTQQDPTETTIDEITQHKELIQCYNTNLDQYNSIIKQRDQLENYRDGLIKQYNNNCCVTAKNYNEQSAYKQQIVQLEQKCIDVIKKQCQLSHYTNVLDNIIARDFNAKERVQEKIRVSKLELHKLSEKEKKTEELRKVAKINEGGTIKESKHLNEESKKEERWIERSIKSKLAKVSQLEHKNVQCEEGMNDLNRYIDEQNVCNCQIRESIKTLKIKNEAYDLIQKSYAEKVKMLQSKLSKCSHQTTLESEYELENTELIKKRIISYLLEIGELKQKVINYQQIYQANDCKFIASGEEYNNLVAKHSQMLKSNKNALHLFEVNLKFIRQVHQSLHNVFILWETRLPSQLTGFKLPILPIEQGNDLILAQTSYYFMDIQKYIDYLTWEVFRAYNYIWKLKYEISYDFSQPFVSLMNTSCFTMKDAYKIMNLYANCTVAKQKLNRTSSLIPSMVEQNNGSQLICRALPNLKMAHNCETKKEPEKVKVIDLQAQCKEETQKEEKKIKPIFKYPKINQQKVAHVHGSKTIYTYYTDNTLEYCDYMSGKTFKRSDEDPSSTQNKPLDAIADEIVQFKKRCNPKFSAYYSSKLSLFKKSIPINSTNTLSHLNNIDKDCKNPEYIKTGKRIANLTSLKNTSKLVDSVKTLVISKAVSNPPKIVAYPKKVNQYECVKMLMGTDSLRHAMKLFGRVKSV